MMYLAKVLRLSGSPRGFKIYVTGYYGVQRSPWVFNGGAAAIAAIPHEAIGAAKVRLEMGDKGERSA